MNQKTLVCMGLISTTLFAVPARAADTGTVPGRIHLLEVTIRTGADQKPARAHLYFQVSRRNDSDGSTVGRLRLLRTKGYEYGPNDKWSPNEQKVFQFTSPEQFTPADLGGLTLVSGMDQPNASDFEIVSVYIVGIDLAGKRWVIADFHPDTAIERHWFGDREATGDSPALPITTMPWRPAPAK